MSKSDKPREMIANRPATEWIENAARCAHEINLAYCRAIGDESGRSWDSSLEWQRESCRTGVREIVDRCAQGGPPTAEEMHRAWCDEKSADGWVHGETKDPERKTHPCLVPYGDLPPLQRTKDRLFLDCVLGLLQYH